MPLASGSKESSPKISLHGDTIEAIKPSLSTLECFECDATQAEQILSITSRTTVLINCVGPYRIYGEDVVAACVETDTDYVDITGEPPFVHSIIDTFHENAKQKGIYIMPACGFGSLPPDVAVETLKEEFNRAGTKCINATGYMKLTGRYAKSFSQGTWNTLINSFSSSGKRSKSQSAPVRRQKKKGVHYVSTLGCWAVPFVEGADLHIIRRTNELTLNDGGSPQFNYSQFTCIPLIPPLWLFITMFYVLLAMIFARFSWGKAILLKRKFPDGGPTAVQRADSYFDMWITGQADRPSDKKTLHMKCPSPYDVTAISCVEVALVLVNQRAEVRPIYGIVTPGAVMNHILLRRLPSKGVSFEFERKNV